MAKIAVLYKLPLTWFEKNKEMMLWIWTPTKPSSLAIDSQQLCDEWH
jgi:hypothetical protein